MQTQYEDVLSQHEQVSNGHLEATHQFLEDFNRRYGTRYGDDQLEDLQSTVIEDIPDYIESGNLEAVQLALESDWSPSDKRLKFERLTALRELHIAGSGRPTPDQLNRSVADVQAALRDANQGKNVSPNKDSYRRVSGAADVIFSARYDQESLEATIDLFEEMILNESITGSDPQRLESLRIVRDKQVERWANERSHTMARDALIEDLVGIAGEDNSDFLRERVEGIIGPRWADGAGLDAARSIVERAQRESDPQKRDALLRDLMNGSIPIENPQGMQDWEAQQKLQDVDDAERERQALIAKKRKEMEPIFARITNGTPAQRESIFQDAIEAEGVPALPSVPAPPEGAQPSKIAASKEKVPPHVPVKKAKQVSMYSYVAEAPPQSHETKGVRGSSGNERSLFSVEQGEEIDDVSKVYRAANVILSRHVPEGIRHEAITMIVQKQSQKAGRPVSAQELVQKLNKRLQGLELPEQVDGEPLESVKRKIHAGNWPKPNSPIWSTRGTHSVAGRARYEVRQDVRKVIEALLQ